MYQTTNITPSGLVCVGVLSARTVKDSHQYMADISDDVVTLNFLLTEYLMLFALSNSLAG